MTKPAYMEKYPHVFSPLEIPIHGGNKTIRFKHRLMESAMGMLIHNSDGTISDLAIYNFTNFAKGGFAAFTTPTEVPFAVMHQRSMRMDTTYNAFADLHRLQKIAHAYDCRTECSMANGGVGFVAEVGEKALTPSPVLVREGVYTKEMDEEQMEEMIQVYVDTCVAAKRAGYDAVQITTCAGTHLHNFLSPIFNKRTDKYGGSAENMARYPLMVLKRVREAIGGDVAIHVRVNGRDDVFRPDWGITPPLAAEYVRMFQEYADYISIFTGHRTTPDNRPTLYPTNFMPDATYADDLREIRRILGDDLKIPLGLNGKVHTPQLAEELIAEGTADFITIGRQALADPNYVNKIKEGREEDIRPCQHCQTCIDGNRRSALSKVITVDNSSSLDIKCKVNPLFYFGEARTRIAQPSSVKRVAVIGGGVAGMQAAQEAAKKGHMVTLYEKTGALGGQLNQFADTLWFAKELVRLREYLKVQVEKSGVHVVLNTEATPEMINAADYDNVIVAVGSKPFVPPIPGADGKNVSLCIDAFGNEANYGENVVIIGGGLAACDAAIYLAENHHNVTVLEQAPYIAMKGVMSERQMILRHFALNDVKAHEDTACTRITEDGVYATNAEGEEVFFPADNVIIAVGNKPLKAEADAYVGTAFDVRKIGDCDQVEDILNCMHGGYDAALVIGVDGIE